MHKRNTVAICSIIIGLILATMFVFVDRPYTDIFWIEIGMICCAGISLMTISYRLYGHTDSTIPLSIVGIKVTIMYLFFVILLSVPTFVTFSWLKTKYYGLIHAFGYGAWAIVMIMLRMGRRAIDNDKVKAQVS